MGRFFWYPDESEDPWFSWYDNQDTAVCARHDVVMRFLQHGQWCEPFFKHLRGYADLQEIRITKGVANKLLGDLYFTIMEFTVVLACTHKADQYYPRDALETAERRTVEIKEGRVIAIPCEQPKPKPRKKVRKGGRRKR